MGEKLPARGEMVPKTSKLPEGNKEAPKDFKSKRAGFSAEPAVLVCKKEERDATLLKPGCSLNIPDKRDRLKFFEALRSAPAFEEMADKLPKYVDLSKRELSAIYPGAGAHIAFLAMAARLMNKNLIDKAKFTLTDISDNAPDNLWKNLNFLAKANNDFKIDKMVKRQNATGGYGVDFYLLYKGKEILITLLIGTSGKDYFHKNDFKNANLFISHDSAECDPHLGMMFMLTKYIDAVRKTGKNIPIVMENIEKYVDYDDWFMDHPSWRYGAKGDLSLFGKFERGSKPYGHRAMQDRKDEKGEEVRTETGKPFAKNAVILKLHERLLKMDVKALDVMSDITGFVLNDEQVGFRLRANLSSDKEELSYPFAHVVGYGEYLLDHVRNISPIFERGLALRILYGIHVFNGSSDAAENYLRKYYSKDLDAGVNRIFKLIDRCLFALGKQDRVALAGEVSILKKVIASKKEIVYEGRFRDQLIVERSNLKKESEDFRKEAGKMNEESAKLFVKIDELKLLVKNVRQAEGRSKKFEKMIEDYGKLVSQYNQMRTKSDELYAKAGLKDKEVESKGKNLDIENKRFYEVSDQLSYKWKGREFEKMSAKFLQMGNVVFASVK